MFKCEICGREFERLDDLGRHVSRTHKLTTKEYYDKFLKKPNEGICKHCGKLTKFFNLKIGYREFCDRTCFWRYTTQLKEVKEKRENTCLKVHRCKASIEQVQTDWRLF